MPKELEKVYDPKQVEDRIYKKWIDDGSFNAEVDYTKPPFCIVIPPPNVTGQLHMGHAMDETLQDILIRFKRMQGYSALWLPGTDHAGIATQIKVEENLRKTEGKTRYDYGREAFIDLVWKWKELYGGRIINQLKKLGSSCDWRRERFTMDEGCSRAVREVFVNLYEKGLIYKGNRIINWCPHCMTALSDAEVEYEEKQGNFWYIKYPIKGENGFVVVATTRPETMLGDTAVAVNPEDERYKSLVGKKLILPLIGREIPVIADNYVEKDFGTGCVKITPCHDPNDFEVGKRHCLEEILIIGNDAKIINGGKYNGMDRYTARKAIICDLEAQGLLLKTESCVHNVGTCYRCSTTVEPITSDQWFVRMAPLADPAINVVESKEIEFVPERFAKIYKNWMENIHDWCISRQLWWGHRIPAWTCDECGELIVSRTDPDICPKCGSKNLTQDSDVLDTWFSSALWPFSTLGWPDNTAELDYFYPTSVLVTGYDIIFFWVARMIFSGLEQMDKKPFSRVFIHGLVRDSEGRKMSKSLGNGIDPIEIIDKYGADALRFTLVTGNSPGNDTRFSYDRVEASRNFVNKLWNASRFVFMHTNGRYFPLPSTFALEDKWILNKINTLISEITDNLEHFELGIAAQKIYDFIWDDFCDWYIELVKPRLTGEDETAANGARGILLQVLASILKLLHPFMPFITEEIWQSIPGESGNLIKETWLKFDSKYAFSSEAEIMTRVMTAIRGVRNRRSEMNVHPAKKIHLLIVTTDSTAYENGRRYIEKLAGASEISFSDFLPYDISNYATIVCGADKLLVPVSELIDPVKEMERLSRELSKAVGEFEKLSGKLSNEGFVKKAPAALVESERLRAKALESSIASLKDGIASLKESIATL